MPKFEWLAPTDDTSPKEWLRVDGKPAGYYNTYSHKVFSGDEHPGLIQSYDINYLFKWHMTIEEAKTHLAQQVCKLYKLCFTCYTPIETVEVDGFDHLCTHCYAEKEEENERKTNER